MKYSRIRRYRKRSRFLDPLLFKSPILVLGLDLPFMIVASVSLRNAAAMSIELFLIHTVTMLFAMHSCRAYPPWLRAMLNAGVSTLVMVAARMLLINLFPGILNSLGMYIYLMALNGMTQLQANFLDKRAKLLPVLGSSVMNALGFAVSAFAVSLVRELFGNGTLWGVAVPISLKLSGLLLPFFGFILVGFLLAIVKYLRKRWQGLLLIEAVRRDAHYTPIKRRRVDE